MHYWKRVTEVYETVYSLRIEKAVQFLGLNEILSIETPSSDMANLFCRVSLKKLPEICGSQTAIWIQPTIDRGELCSIGFTCSRGYTLLFNCEQTNALTMWLPLCSCWLQYSVSITKLLQIIKPVEFGNCICEILNQIMQLNWYAIQQSSEPGNRQKFFSPFVIQHLLSGWPPVPGS